MSVPEPLPQAKPPAPNPPRFSWPMRIFLFLLLFDIVFRSFSVLIPWEEWAKELKMRTMPVRLATAAERQRLAKSASPDNPDPVTKDTLEALQSLRTFLTPWPDEETGENITTWTDAGKFTVVWLSSRLDFVENLIGFNEEWPMFSPNVGRHKSLARARLIYEDESERIIRNHGDPVDLNAYAHWNEEKVLDHELKVRAKGAEDECFGYCNMLAHRYPRNNNGSSLVRIRLFEVDYTLPPPGVDYRQWYLEQMRLTPDYPGDSPGPDLDTKWQTNKSFYEFDVKKWSGQSLVKD
jgi:hypothetical protein